MTVAILFFQSAEAEIEQCPVFGRLGKRPLFFLILSCRFGRIHREDVLHCVRFFESLGNNRGHGTNLGFGNSLCALFFILFCPLGKKFLRKIFIKQEMPFYSSGGFFIRRFTLCQSCSLPAGPVNFWLFVLHLSAILFGAVAFFSILLKTVF